jgi:glucose/arabinose dehydrogenase
MFPAPSPAGGRGAQAPQPAGPPSVNGPILGAKAPACAPPPAFNNRGPGGIDAPFGMAFHDGYLYVGNTGSVVRFKYTNGDMKAQAAPEKLLDLPVGGHSTRNIVFNRAGTKMYLAVGSGSNNNAGEDCRRAAILEFNPDGSGYRVYASGIRNPVGLTLQPDTDTLWVAVNERDNLGDDLVPDYVTRVKENAFYGWPWFYIGDHQDPRHPGARPDLKDKITVPDVLLQAHSASLGLTFYEGNSFPAEYRGDAFAAEHGSWNRSKRTGYKVVRIRLKDGVPTGEYEDFVTGFVVNDNEVWGRPVGVAVARDGALLISEDGNGTIWRVSH